MLELKGNREASAATASKRPPAARRLPSFRSLVLVQQAIEQRPRREVELRRQLLEAQSEVRGLQTSIKALLPDERLWGRGEHLRSLSDLIGERPQHTWEQEWDRLYQRFRRDQRQSEHGGGDGAGGDGGDGGGGGVSTSSEEGAVKPISAVVETRASAISEMVQYGWARPDAEVIAVLSFCNRQLAHSLARRSPEFAACIYSISDILHRERERQEVWRRLHGYKPRRLYRNLYGSGDQPDGLVEENPLWRQIEEADDTGFVGLTSRGIVRAFCDPAGFNESGYMTLFERQRAKRVTAHFTRSRTSADDDDGSNGKGGKGKGGSGKGPDRAVVCFEVGGPEEASGQSGFRTPVYLSKQRGYFPPNTLFSRVAVLPPGSWEAPTPDGHRGPPLKPNARLIIVAAHYHDTHSIDEQPEHQAASACGTAASSTPSSGTGGGGGVVGGSGSRVRRRSSGGKMCSEMVELDYGRRDAFVNGIRDLLSKPVLTMRDEWASRDLRWRDRAGREYTTRAEWAYVVGTAKRTPGCTPGVRDANNDGRTVDDFIALANAHISSVRGGYLDRGIEEEGGEDDALLTREEVIALRLYTGPGYQPINGFLRQASTLQDGQTPNIRQEVLMNPLLTFAATIGHLIAGIRKLSYATPPEQANVKLYRGVRGVLPRKFWVSDSLGHICAVEMGFMSTSKKAATPISYMGNGTDDPPPNVLWELEARSETGDGFHYGADVRRSSSNRRCL